MPHCIFAYLVMSGVRIDELPAIFQVSLGGNLVALNAEKDGKNELGDDQNYAQERRAAGENERKYGGG